MLQSSGIRSLGRKPLLDVGGMKYLSSESGGFLSSIKNTISGDSKSASTRDKQYAKQIEQMAYAKSWTLNSFTDQVRESTGGWRSMIPGMGGVDAMKQMKATQKLLEAAMDVLGSNAGATELQEMKKKEKLQISLKSGAPMQDINALIQQFESMDIMHRVLRYRVENDLPLPGNEEDAKNIIQADVKNALSERELKDMQRKRQKLLQKLRR